MSTIAIPITAWRIDYHRTMAAVLAASDALNRGVSILVLAKDFWRAANDLEMFVAVMDSVTEAPRDEIEPVMAGLEGLHCRIKGW